MRLFFDRGDSLQYEYHFLLYHVPCSMVIPAMESEQTQLSEFSWAGDVCFPTPSGKKGWQAFGFMTHLNVELWRGNTIDVATKINAWRNKVSTK